MSNVWKTKIDKEQSKHGEESFPTFGSSRTFLAFQTLFNTANAVLYFNIRTSDFCWSKRARLPLPFDLSCSINQSYYDPVFMSLEPQALAAALRKVKRLRDENGCWCSKSSVRENKQTSSFEALRFCYHFKLRFVLKISLLEDDALWW